MTVKFSCALFNAVRIRIMSGSALHTESCCVGKEHSSNFLMMLQSAFSFLIQSNSCSDILDLISSFSSFKYSPGKRSSLALSQLHFSKVLREDVQCSPSPSWNWDNYTFQCLSSCFLLHFQLKSSLLSSLFLFNLCLKRNCCHQKQPVVPKILHEINALM